MAKNKQAIALKEQWETRVEKSLPLVEKMGFTQEQYTRIVLNAIVMRPDIVKCDPASLDKALLRCIELGLVPDGDDAVIASFKGKAQLIPMVNGRVRLAKQATPGLSIRSKCVYRDDEFEYEEGLEPVLRHIPNPEGARSNADIVAAYAIAKAPGQDAPEFVVLLRSDLDRIKAMSPSGDRGPWGQFEPEMCEKSAKHRVCKNLLKKPGMPMIDEEDTPEIFDAGELPITDVEVVEEVEDRVDEKPEAQEEKPQPKRRGRKPKAAKKPEPEPEMEADLPAPVGPEPDIDADYEEQNDQEDDDGFDDDVF